MSARSTAELLLGAGSDEAFSALADRTRRRVLVRLAERPDDAGAVARDLEVSRQAVAKHLRVLERAGMVHSVRDARRRVHRVDAATLREISDLLAVVARGWDQRLAGIAEEAERRERDGHGAEGECPAREGEEPS